jgi:hypothetical protein
MVGQVRPVVVSATRTRSRASQQEQDVGADAVFQAVVDGAQVEDGLHVAPAAFDFEELLVPERDVLCGQFGSLERSRYWSAAGTCRRGVARP